MDAIDPNRDVSIVVPVYNEELRIGPCLARLVEFGRTQLRRFELLIIDDGSLDGSKALIASLAAKETAIRLISYSPNRGKGAAVRMGVQEASLPYTLFTDADLSTPIEDVEKLFAKMGSAPVAIGSRALSDSRVEVHQPLYREWMGQVFNQIVQRVAIPGIHDSQCGFKLFQTDVARRLFEQTTIDGFAFDVEILFLCRRLGIPVVEVPVRWRNDVATKVRPIRDASRMLRDLARIRWVHRGLAAGNDVLK